MIVDFRSAKYRGGRRIIGFGFIRSWIGPAGQDAVTYLADVTLSDSVVTRLTLTESLVSNLDLSETTQP